MRCWQCGQVVAQDETVGPTEGTRSSLAKFNEQMAGIFSILHDMDRVQFARHILEPPIAVAPIDEAEKEKARVFKVDSMFYS